MRLEVLGPLRIRDGNNSIEITSGRQRAVLAHLVAAGGAVVSTGALIDAVWGDDLPSNPENTLQHAIAQLRKLLEPGRSRGEPPTVLVSVGEGYRLDFSSLELDEELFARSVEEATSLLHGGVAGQALEIAQSGLDLWRGAAYADVVSEHIRLEQERLEEMRIAARVLAADALAEVSGPESAVPAFEALIAEYPLRESLWAKLMTALYRSSRQAEALRVYKRVSDLLGEELGLVPSKELRDLEELILAQDPTLHDRSDRSKNISVPSPSQPLIGRQAEMSLLSELIDDARLVTLLGPGGSGKTRLAIEAASRLESSHPDGVWFVRLDELEDETLLAAQIGSVLGMPEDPDRNVEDTLASYVGDRSVALVLDNCEHLIDAVARLVARLLERCANLTVLTTSQQPLNIRAERRLPVPPLALPGQDDDASPFADLESVDSVRLFIDRATAVDPELDLSDESLRAIANIVSALDGLPLAIELAAARADMFTPVELALRIGDRFGVLTDGPRDAPERQRELRSVFEWSFSLLDANGQRCLSELSVFTGSFDVAAAAAALDKPVEMAQGILGHFAQRSLLERERTGGAVTRFRMLESLKQFAAGRLAATGDVEETRARHARFYLDRVVALDEQLTGPRQSEAFRELVAESENVRSALAWSLRSGRHELGVPLAARCGRFWDWRGSVAEANTWYPRFIDAQPVETVPVLGLLWSWHGYFVLEAGDVDTAREISAHARALSARQQDTLSAAAAASVGAVIARHDGGIAVAIDLDDEARTLAVELGDRWLEAWADNHDALCLLASDDTEAAWEPARASLAMFEALGDQRGVGWATTVLATVALQAGDLTEAASLSESAAELSRRVGDGRNAAWALEIAAEAADTADEGERAETLRAEARELLIERGVPFSPWRR